MQRSKLDLTPKQEALAKSLAKGREAMPFVTLSKARKQVSEHMKGSTSEVARLDQRIRAKIDLGRHRAENKVVFSTRIAPDVHAKLRRVSEVLGIPMSQVVEDCVRNLPELPG